MATDPPQKSARSTRREEAGFLALLLLLTGILTRETFKFRAVPWDSMGLTFWPRILLAVLAIAVVIRFLGLRRDTAPGEVGLVRGLAILAVCAVFVLALPVLGVYLLTPLFLAVFVVAQSGPTPRERLRRFVLANAVLLPSIWLLFDLALGLRVLSLPFWWQ
ncbi:tripartite tricarboxylate transporter TctB family protein [Natronohydrobacter thiooxidans]|uniref:tripartite tricarboxylate transporter TctB family protein n=1 Tax=Natronohydrobacter thiooxidans TaxID=87172 RepID=UPI0008FF1F6A|nr:tripartite tricarboxylate transporter TctB family protein [Natronohydrobacter thiooxidans]